MVYMSDYEVMYQYESVKCFGQNISKGSLEMLLLIRTGYYNSWGVFLKY